MNKITFSTETIQGAIEQSLRARTIAKLGTFLVLIIFLIFIAYLSGFTKEFGSYYWPGKTEIFIAIFLGILFFVILNLRYNFYFIDPIWFIKKPTHSEIEKYICEKKKELRRQLKDSDDDLKRTQDFHNSLRKEADLFFHLN